MVVPNFVRQALAEQPITVFGDGSQQRCFCHVADVVRALADITERDDAFGRVFNIGSNEEVSIRELAERVRELTGSSSEIQLVPYEEAYQAGFEDMVRRIPDLTKIKDTIGWAPTKRLAEILEDVVANQRAGAPV